MDGQRIDGARDLQRDARAHQDVVHAREQGPVDGGEVRDLDLLEVVDADRVAVALAGQPDLDEVGHDAEFPQVRTALPAVHRQRRIGAPLVLAPLDEEARRESRSAMAGTGKASRARRMWPPGSPSWRRLASTWSSAVPDTTPRAPAVDTALARRQSEMATPMPPWMSAGKVPTAPTAFTADTCTFTGVRTASWGPNASGRPDRLSPARQPAGWARFRRPGRVRTVLATGT